MSELYPGQEYVHKNNANIKRAEENFMTEKQSSAARGEGLAGLAKRWRDIAGPPECWKGATPTDTAILTAGRATMHQCADELETAATRERMHQRAVREKVCNLRGLMMAARNSLDPDGHILTYADIILELENYEEVKNWLRKEVAKLLATPSPQAPPEQSNTFSTTSAREQSVATASDSPSVGYSEDSPFSVNHAALAKAQVSANIVAPNPHCPLCFGTGSWVEGERCACTERPLR